MTTYSRFFCALVLLAILSASSESGWKAPLGKLLEQRYEAMTPDQTEIVLVYFTNKGPGRTVASLDPRTLVSERSLQRRMKVRQAGSLVDDSDLPLDQSYVASVGGRVVALRHQLKWFNAVSAIASKSQIEKLRALPFVKEIDLVGRWARESSSEAVQSGRSSDARLRPQSVDSLDYGPSLTQLQQINVPAVHNLGFHGEGVVIGMFDDGVKLQTHEAFSSMDIIAQHDFVDHKTSVVPLDPNAGGHGTSTLSAIGGYMPGKLIGPAYAAHFILARTENDSSETPIEEDNWATAIEWADSIGVDVTSTSLGYLAFDPPYTSWTWQNMDGNTTVITRAADHAVGLGIVVLNSAGNSGYNSSHNTLIAPADGDSVITVGAVDATGARASFSSVGPTFDGRIKPDIAAMGVSDYLASASGNSSYGSGSGTSFSCPLSAGVAALVLCAHPELTPMQVRESLRQTASQAMAADNLLGWGIIDAYAAVNYYNSVKVSPDWNLLSLPVSPADGRAADLFPTARSRAYIYNSGYKNADTLTNGVGFWLKFSSSARPVINGPLLTCDTVNLVAGWNIIGGPSFPIPISAIVQIPPAIITPIFYEYNLGYSVATTLKPGMGYWVKASSPEQLVLCTDSTSYNAEAVTRPRISDEEFNSLTVTDRDGRSQSLHFGGANGRPVIGEAVELPPRPPAEAFDVRFGDGTAVWGNEADSREVTVEVQGARYPIEVTWRMKPGGGSYSMVTMSDAGKEVSRNDLTGSGKITLQDARSGSLVLRKGGSGSVQSTVPRTYGLDQNYPNPFNPSTSISYELPVTSYVKVVVVNVLGQEVARLVDGVQSAGLRTVEFDAGSLPSGMYFYRMEASSAAGGRTSFTATRKMLLLK